MADTDIIHATPRVMENDCIKMLFPPLDLHYFYSNDLHSESRRIVTSVLRQWRDTLMQLCYYWVSPGQFTATCLISALKPKRRCLHKNVAHICLREWVYSKLSKDTGDHQAHSSAFSGNGWQSELVSMSPHSLHVVFNQTHHRASMISV